MLKAIKEKGFLIIPRVLNVKEVSKALSLLPKPLPKTKGPGFSFSLTHSDYAKYLRTHPKIKEKFECIWGTKELTVSLDSPIIWTSLPKHVENMHLDQNPHHKPDFCCIQGMIHLTTTSLGGLQLIEKSNATYQDIIEKYPEIKETTNDWLELGKELEGTKIPTIAGTMIFWDSRTIHGAYIGRESSMPRISFPICMLPGPPKDIELRERAIREKLTLNHWGTELH